MTTRLLLHLCCAVLCCAVLCCAVLCCAVLCYAALLLHPVAIDVCQLMVGLFTLPREQRSMSVWVIT
jgi:hypothetical protein